MLSLVAEASLSDDLAGTQDKLDVLREKLGITSGWGMKPGDKGYQPMGLPSLNAAVQPEVMLNAPHSSTVSGVTIQQPA